MDTLNLIGADDGVLKSGTVLENEDGVLVTTFVLTGTLDATAIGLHASIKSAADGLGRREGHAALRGRYGEGCPLLQGVVNVGIVGVGKSRS